MMRKHKLKLIKPINQETQSPKHTKNNTSKRAEFVKNLPPIDANSLIEIFLKNTCEEDKGKAVFKFMFFINRSSSARFHIIDP